MNVSEIMTKNVATVTPETDLHTLAMLFVDKDISGAPVLDRNGSLVGIVLEEGLILQDKKLHLPTLISILSGVFALGESRFEKELQKIAAITVQGIMETDITILKPETPVEDVATMIVEKGKHYFSVVDNGALVGVVTKKDIVRAIAQHKIW